MKKLHLIQKRIFVFLALLFFVSQAAAFPQLLPVQGKLKGGTVGDVNKVLPMTFSFYSEASGGTAFWAETRNVDVNVIDLDNNIGVFTTLLGDAAWLDVNAHGDWNYLGIKIQDNLEMVPRIKLGASAYSFISQKALSVDDAWFFAHDTNAGGGGLPDSTLDNNALAQAWFWAHTQPDSALDTNAAAQAWFWAHMIVDSTCDNNDACRQWLFGLDLNAGYQRTADVNNFFVQLQNYVGSSVTLDVNALERTWLFGLDWNSALQRKTDLNANWYGKLDVNNNFVGFVSPLNTKDVNLSGGGITAWDGNFRTVEADYLFGDGYGLTNVINQEAWDDLNSNLVPYFGARRDVNFGPYSLIFNEWCEASGTSCILGTSTEWSIDELLIVDALDVAKDSNLNSVTATAFFGDGSGLTGVDNLPDSTLDNNVLAQAKFWTLLNANVPWADVNVANDITLDNLTQITTRNYSDLQGLPYIPSEADIDLNAMFWDTNTETACDGNTVSTGTGACIDITDFYLSGSAISDTNFQTFADFNNWYYSKFISLQKTADQNNFFVQLQNAYSYDTNAQTACDGNSVLTGDGDCVSIIDFYLSGGADGFTATLDANADERAYLFGLDWNSALQRKTDLNANFYGKLDVNRQFVPYIGATRDMNLGTHSIAAIQLVGNALAIGPLSITIYEGSEIISTSSSPLNFDTAVEVASTVTALEFYGDGSGLTGITTDVNGKNIKPANVQVDNNLSVAGNIAGVGDANFSKGVQATAFFGSGAALTGIASVGDINANFYGKLDVNNAFVPYIGATKDINIGDNNLTVNRKLNAATHGGRTIIVAASNSPNKNQADYICDGTADQTEIIAAIESIGTNGGTIQLLRGTYNLSDRVFPSISIYNLLLTGYGAELKATATGTMYGLLVFHPLERHKNIHIEGLTVNGNNNASISYGGIRLGAVGGSIRDCNVVNFGADTPGIKIETTSGIETRNIEITNNRVIGGTTTMSYGIILNSVFSNALIEGIRIIGNRVENTKYNAIAMYGEVYNTIVSNNTIINSGHSAISCSPAAHITITNNIISGGNFPDEGSIEIEYKNEHYGNITSHNVIVSNNTISGANWGIFVHNRDNNLLSIPHDISITSNIVSDSNRGIYLYSGYNIAILGNVLYDNNKNIEIRPDVNYTSIMFDTNINPNIISLMGGFVGIGTTSPTVRLDVNGNARITGDLNVAEDSNLFSVTAGFFFGNGSGLTGVTATSDVNGQDVNINKLGIQAGLISIADANFLKAVKATAFFGSGANLTGILSQVDVNANFYGKLDVNTHFVPYIGATKDVNLNRFDLNANKIVAGWGSVSKPGYAFDRNTSTGMFFDPTPGALFIERLGFAVSGVASFYADAFGLMTGDGTASAPSYSFYNDGGTGFYRLGLGHSGITSNTKLVADFNTNSVTSHVDLNVTSGINKGVSITSDANSVCFPSNSCEMYLDYNGTSLILGS